MQAELFPPHTPQGSISIPPINSLHSLSNGLTIANSTIGALNAVGRSVQGFGSGLTGSLQIMVASAIAAATIYLGAASDVQIGIGITFVASIVALLAAIFAVSGSH